jgi:hypothetical protein
MRTSFHHQSEAQPPNGPLTVATSPDTPSTTQPGSAVSLGYVRFAKIRANDAFAEPHAFREGEQD